jgi:hypothetical protein
MRARKFSTRVCIFIIMHRALSENDNGEWKTSSGVEDFKRELKTSSGVEDFKRELKTSSES